MRGSPSSQVIFVMRYSSHFLLKCTHFPPLSSSCHSFSCLNLEEINYNFRTPTGKKITSSCLLLSCTRFFVVAVFWGKKKTVFKIVLIGTYQWPSLLTIAFLNLPFWKIPGHCFLSLAQSLAPGGVLCSLSQECRGHRDAVFTLHHWARWPVWPHHHGGVLFYG